jgi:hypothetical protein
LLFLKFKFKNNHHFKIGKLKPKSQNKIQVKYVENLDQWHALLKTVIIRRTWSSSPEVQDALNHFIRDLVKRTRSEYSSQSWAAEDERFLWINAQN